MYSSTNCSTDSFSDRRLYDLADRLVGKFLQLSNIIIVDGGSASDYSSSSNKNKSTVCQFSCGKKVGLVEYRCRCGGTFCRRHRHPEDHECRFDFKAAGRLALAKQNPTCVADKLAFRV